MRRPFPYKTVPCQHCSPETESFCTFCYGSGREIVLVDEDREQFFAACHAFVKAAKGYIAAIGKLGQ